MGLLLPRRTNFRYYHRWSKSFYKPEQRVFDGGDIGLKLLKNVRLRASQLEAIRIAIVRRSGRRLRSKIPTLAIFKIRKTAITDENWWERRKAQIKPQLHCFPALPVTAKSSGTRMGKGKGAIKFWSTLVRPSRVIFSLRQSRQFHWDAALRLLRKVSRSLPVASKIVIYRRGFLRKMFNFRNYIRKPLLMHLIKNRS